MNQLQVGGDVTEHSQASRSALFNALVEAKLLETRFYIHFMPLKHFETS